jgi:hypothetical protein
MNITNVTTIQPTFMNCLQHTSLGTIGWVLLTICGLEFIIILILCWVLSNNFKKPLGVSNGTIQ